jgi:hypothetical protein
VSAFDALESPQVQNCDPVCVPWYVYHKMMAGLLDQYTRTGNQQALDVVVGMAAWAQTNIEGVLARGGMDLWQAVLGVEWGGMNDALYQLYSITSNANHLTTAHYFNHYVWTAPLAINVDPLTNEHANTHIPEIIGEARGYELTGNSTQYNITANFFNIVTSTRSFATGGSNDHEYWGAPHMLGDQMDSSTEESCTQYNILKVARHLYQWSGSSTYADFYERALFNGLIGNQNELTPYNVSEHNTGFIYFLPLGGSGLTKPWGPSNDGFPCCWGTLSETFSKLADSIFFESSDGYTLFVNLFASSSVWWTEQNVVIAQSAGFPTSLLNTTVITVQLPPGQTWVGLTQTFQLAIRVPDWATGANSVTINGQPVSQSIAPGTYLYLNRSWSIGDSVVIYFPASLRVELLNDNRTSWNNVGAIMYGGILLAGLSSTDVIPDVAAANITSLIARVGPPDSLVFTTTFPSVCAQAGNITLIPLMDVMFDEYVVYWHFGGSSAPIGFNASGYSVIPGDDVDFDVSGGAGIVSNGPDMNIRSGNPDEINTVSYTTYLQDSSHFITGLAFSYQYVSGYGPAGQPVGTNFSVVAVDSCGRVVSTFYSSPNLVDYPFDVCNTCYSPPVNVTLPPGSFKLPVVNQTTLAFVFQDNDRNLQLNLPLDITVLLELNHPHLPRYAGMHHEPSWDLVPFHPVTKLDHDDEKPVGYPTKMFKCIPFRKFDRRVQASK